MYKDVSISESYNGSDYVVVLNNKVYGQFQSVNVDSLSKRIEINVGLFENFSMEDDIELRKIRRADFYEAYLSESSTMFRPYSYLNYIGFKSNNSLDSSVLSCTYIFEYCAENELQKLDAPFNVFLENVIKESNNA